MISASRRRFLAVLSACGLAASTAAYIGSFFRASADNIFLWYLPLLLEWMALFAPIYVLEYPASKSPSFAWKGFARGMPSWVAPCSWLLSLIGLVHFLWFAVHSGWGVPKILDGQYVLDAGGHGLKVLTQAEYFKLRAEGARVFAIALVYFYFTPMMYWWFPRPSANSPLTAS